LYTSEAAYHLPEHQAFLLDDEGKNELVMIGENLREKKEPSSLTGVIKHRSSDDFQPVQTAAIIDLKVIGVY
jgi:uncharacterized protein YciI